MSEPNPTAVQIRLGYDREFLEELRQEGVNLDTYSDFVDGSHHLGLFDGVGADNTTGSGDAGASPQNFALKYQYHDHFDHDHFAALEEDVATEIWIAAYNRWLEKQAKLD